MNIIIFENFTPFFKRTAVKGKAAYIGPAANDAINIDNKIPTIPELSPMYFIIDSLETHTSKRPSINIIGGKTDSICKKLDFVLLNAPMPRFLLKIKIAIKTNIQINEYLYLFRKYLRFIYKNTIPIMKATIIENKKAIKFLKNAALFPIYFASKLNVKTPTKVRVDTNAET